MFKISLTQIPVVTVIKKVTEYKPCINLRLNKKNILITAGSDLAIKNCFELLIKKDDTIVTIYPTY